MCEPNWWWWTLLFAMTASGIFGGVVRYYWDKLEGNGHGSCARYAILGVGAALMVPLFLNTLSSTLIQESDSDQSKVFILIGFCLAASIFAKQFMGSVSRKALELSQEAKQIAVSAMKSADAAEQDAKRADNRALAVVPAFQLIDQDDFAGANALLSAVLESDPDNSEAWAWKAYCLKRVASVQDAIVAMQKAIDIEGRPVYGWLYNKACYLCLAKAPVEVVVATLTEAKNCASSSQLARMRASLLSDTDFGSLMQDSIYMAFIDGLPKGEPHA